MNEIISHKLFEVFKSYNKRPFVFVVPGGNFGDELIYMGAEKLARAAGLEFTPVGHDEFMTAEYPGSHVIYINGSGALNDFWSKRPMDELIRAVNHHKGVVILGPSTCMEDKEFFEQWAAENFRDNRPEKVLLFARELITLEIMKCAFPEWMDIRDDHDTALNLEIKDMYQTEPERKYTLYAIRTDKERSQFTERSYFSPWIDPVNFAGSFESWLDLHKNVKAVITNRTHSAVLGHILGVPTTILPNNYHKNRSIWEYSLKGRGVKWADAPEIGVCSRVIGNLYPLRRLFGSYKFQSAMRRFYGIRGSL